MFISFEGIDGSGKSTQIARLADRLLQNRVEADVFREPGGSPLAENIRSLLLDPGYDIQPFAELLLFSAARAQLVSARIRPALEAGRVVICDRFFDSTTAYQGAGRRVESVEWLQAFHLKVTGGLAPDRTYLLDVPVEEALDRRVGRGEADRMEQVDVAFYRRVAGAYRELAEANPDRFRVFDAMQSVDSLHEMIWNDIGRVREQLAGTRAMGQGSSTSVS